MYSRPISTACLALLSTAFLTTPATAQLIKPDLSPTALTVSTTNLSSRLRMWARSTIQQHNFLATSAATTSSYYLSTNNIISTSDTHLCSWTTPALPWLATHTVTCFFNVPLRFSNGTRYLGVIADRTRRVAETNENNNTRAVRVTWRQADLIVSALSAPTILTRNTRVSISSTVRNIGNLTARSSTALCVLSRDFRITTSDKFLFNRAVNTLLAGRFHTSTTSVVIPASTATGTCYVGMIADRLAQVTEASETNNTRALRRTCRGGPDLIVDLLSANTASFAAGGTVTVTSRVRNIGGDRTPRTTRATIHLSTNSIITNSDPVIGTRPVNILNPNSTHTVVQFVRIPTNTRPGTCWLGAFADNPNLISEVLESNNTRALRRTCSGKPDLVVDLLTANTTVFIAGRRPTVSSRIRNAGGVSTGRTTTASYYLSTNSSITTTDTLLGNRTTNTLLPGQSHSSSQLVTIPGNTATRSCWLGVIADRLRQVAEVSETNNTRALLRSCRALPDLIVSRLVPNTTTWRPNAIIQIDSTIRNDGAVTTGRTTTATAYLSSDAIITTSDLFLANRATNILNPTASHRIIQNVRIPSNARIGRCWLGMIADRLGQVTEAFETNNTRAVRGVCANGRPDLTISALSAPTTLIAGTFAVISSTTRNSFPTQGPASSSVTGIVLSKDVNITTSDVLLGSYSTGVLAINASRTFSTRYFVPYCTRTATCFVGAIADMANTVSELSEANNTRSLRRSCAGYVGTRAQIEFVPSFTSAATSTSSASYFLRRGPRTAEMCIVAPRLPNHWYLCLWSFSASPLVIDAATNLSLGLTNGPILPLWLNRLDATGRSPAGFPKTNLPNVALPSSLTLFTHVAFFDPSFSQLVRFGSNSIRNKINP